MADLGGCPQCVPPPPYGPKFSQFHAVFHKIWENHMLAPPSPWRAGAPSYGKSWIHPLRHLFSQGCARFPEFTQNSSEHQILWSLCSVDFHTLTLQLPIQTLHSVVHELLSFCEFTSKMSKFQQNEHIPG